MKLAAAGGAVESGRQTNAAFLGAPRPSGFAAWPHRHGFHRRHPGYSAGTPTQR